MILCDEISLGCAIYISLVRVRLLGLPPIFRRKVLQRPLCRESHRRAGDMPKGLLCLHFLDRQGVPEVRPPADQIMLQHILALCHNILDSPSYRSPSDSLLSNSLCAMFCQANPKYVCDAGSGDPACHLLTIYTYQYVTAREENVTVTANCWSEFITPYSITAQQEPDNMAM